MRFSAAGWNYVLQDAVGPFISPKQRGFVKRRSIVQNLMNLDAGARCSGFNPPTSCLPMLLLLDMRAAFPSVGHGWLRRVLRWMQSPTVFLRVFGSLLALVSAMMIWEVLCTLASLSTEVSYKDAR